MEIRIRRFENSDIRKKVEWINNPENNKFLHYDLPLEIKKTEMWFDKVKDRTDRYDATILVDGTPCGIIGLLNIDRINSKAEYYISMGEVKYKGKGVAITATKLLLEYAFSVLMLNKVYLFTEIDNIAAQKLFEKAGFIKEGCLKKDLFSNGKYVDRFCYGMCKEDYKGQ